MITQVHERREHIVAHHRRFGGRAAGRGRGDRGARQTILQLEHDALRRLLADAGNRGEPREVAPLDRAQQLLRLDPRQHRQRDLRTDAADADQPLEQLLLEQRREAVQRQRVLAHVGMDPQRDARRPARRAP